MSSCWGLCQVARCSRVDLSSGLGRVGLGNRRWLWLFLDGIGLVLWNLSVSRPIGALGCGSRIRGLRSLSLSLITSCRLLLLRPLLVRIQEAFRDPPGRVCPAADPSVEGAAPAVLVPDETLDLAVRVRVVIREASARITVAGRVVCDDAEWSG